MKLDRPCGLCRRTRSGTSLWTWLLGGISSTIIPLTRGDYTCCDGVTEQDGIGITRKYL